MKVIPFVLTFAASLAAQQPTPQKPDPEIELAAPIAAETQERDLAKAERLYREAIDGGKLSVEGRQVATMRLARMLRTLGRTKEGDALMEKLMREMPVASLDDVTEQPQDAEREAALRKQAEDVVATLARPRDPNVSTTDSPLRFFPADPSKQLLWIGQAAVPVVIARLEAFTKADAYDPDVTSGLAGFLWRVGGPQSRQFFVDAAKNATPAWRANWTRTAFQASNEMLATAALFLRDPDESVFENLLTSPPRPNPVADPSELRYRLPQADIVDAALGVDGDARKAWVLRWATADVPLEPEPRERLVAFVGSNLVRNSLVGVAAEDFVLSWNAQRSVAGLELLLRQLPRLAAAGRPPQLRAPKFPVPIGTPPNGAVPIGGAVPDERPRTFTKDEAMRLLPATAQAAADTKLGVEVRAWLGAVVTGIAAPLDGSVLPHALAWIRLGLVSSDDVLRDRITAANYRDVASLLPQVSPLQVARLAQVLVTSPIDPPIDLSAMLRDAADAVSETGVRGLLPPSATTPDRRMRELLQGSSTPSDADTVVVSSVRANLEYLVARAGDPAFAEWLRARGRTWPLIELGRRSKDERVRVAMRTLFDPKRFENEALLMALLAMHDVPSLELLPLVENSAESPRDQHPYRSKEDAPLLTPLQYLVYRDADPPHGFTEDEVIGVLQKIAARGIPQNWEPKTWAADAIPDRVLGELARLTAIASQDRMPYRADWIWTIQERLKARAERNEPLGSLVDWHQQMLTTPAAHVVLYYLDEATAVRLRPQIERLVDSEDDQTVFSATTTIARYFDVKTIEWAKRLIASRVKSVREGGLEIAAELRGEEGEAIALKMTEDPSELRGDAAAALGAMVSVKAVPRLVELLRDPEGYVREKAAEALTRIRFYHEQQAHWDRVLKGLDASPASAAEKLLLQAKPAAPKAQRLLAIKSLGTLGVPEALPFLIDWTTDPDAEVAAAATAAITAIHLNPRR